MYFNRKNAEQKNWRMIKKGKHFLFGCSLVFAVGATLATPTVHADSVEAKTEATNSATQNEPTAEATTYAAPAVEVAPLTPVASATVVAEEKAEKPATTTENSKEEAVVATDKVEKRDGSFFHIETGEELEQAPAKMSKSLKNVVNPDDVVERYGADTLRVYEMFMGPLDASIAWSEEGLEGSRKFLDRVYRLLTTKEIVAENSGALDKVYNQTVKAVTEQLEELKFNTAIAQLMVFVNAANKEDKLFVGYAKGFVQLLAPFAPHLSEELWQTLTQSGESISYVLWPTWDEAKLVENDVEIVVQIKGKVRAKLVVPKDSSREELEKLALANKKIQVEIAGKQVIKVIVVPNKLVNIVVK